MKMFIYFYFEITKTLLSCLEIFELDLFGFFKTLASF